jgi:DNA-binding transcriptional ArsR family regulator
MGNIDWSKYSFLLTAKNRRKILLALDKPRIPTELASISGLNLSHVSRALRELSNKGIVECLTPKSRVGKLYKRTKFGDEIVSYLRKRE